MKRVGALLGAVLGFAVVGEARAADAQAFADAATHDLVAVEHDVPSVDEAVRRMRDVGLSATERVRNGAALLDAGDYARAAVVFSKVMEKYPDTLPAADATFLRGETFFATKEDLSARRDYWALANKAEQNPQYREYLVPALARLVDVTLRFDETADHAKAEGELAKLQARLDRLSTGASDPLVQYARGKAAYFRKDYATAQAAFAAVPPNHAFQHQARYFQGLVAYRQIRVAAGLSDAPLAEPAAVDPSKLVEVHYKPAVDAFARVTQLPGDSPSHRHTIDLAWMAMGRLFYEMGMYMASADAYGRIERDSPEVDRMLYELAWVHVRAGDEERASRALELLSLIAPDSIDVPDGSLVRGDILLRAGRFQEALKAYREVRGRYVPMRDGVERFLSSTTDAAVYFDRLAVREDAVAQQDTLPPVAARWARQIGQGGRAFALRDDLVLSRTLLASSKDLLARLRMIAGSGTRVRLFPDLLAGEERAVGLLNQVSRARLELAQGLDASEPADLGGEIGQVRQQRRALMGGIAQMPVSSGDFDARDRAGEVRWNKVSQVLTTTNTDIDRQFAITNGLRQVLAKDKQHSASDLTRLTADLTDSENVLHASRLRAGALRKEIEQGRVLIGFGDARYQDDAKRRVEFQRLLEREVQLASAGQAGSDARDFAGRAQPSLAQARALDERLTAAFFTIDREVEERTTQLRGRLAVEASNVDRHEGDLEALAKDVRGVAGAVMAQDLRRVGAKLRSIVLRADVGITEQAWEVRQDELDRLRSLQSERARQEQVLDEELREVLDDASEQSSPAAR